MQHMQCLLAPLSHHATSPGNQDNAGRPEPLGAAGQADLQSSQGAHHLSKPTLDLFALRHDSGSLSSNHTAAGQCSGATPFWPKTFGWARIANAIRIRAQMQNRLLFTYSCFLRCTECREIVSAKFRKCLEYDTLSVRYVKLSITISICYQTL